MKIVHTEFIAVLQCRITSAGHVNHILLHILADNKPRSSTQPQSFTLADGMKPIARCLPNFLPVSNSTISPSLSPRKRAQNHYNQSFPESRCPDCHDVWRWAIRHAGYVTNLILHQSAQWKHQFGNLQIIYLCQKVGLVFHGIGSGTEPCLSIPQHRSGVVPGCRDIEILPHTLLKAPELISLLHITSGLGVKPRLILSMA